MSGHQGAAAAADEQARRLRTAGPLSAKDVADLRQAGVPLAYDPVLIGWFPADCEDDLPHDIGLRPWPVASAGHAPAPDLTLRPWAADEGPVYAALLGDPRVWLYLPDPMAGQLTAELARDLIHVLNTAPHHRVRAAVVGGVPVGQVRLHLTSPDAGAGEAEISYWLGADHWGRGIATAMVRQFTADCLAVLPGLRAVVARAHGDNSASLRVLDKAGYVAQGPCPRDPAWRVFRFARR